MFKDIFSTCSTLSDEILAQYVELEMAGQDPRQQMPEVAVHLDECVECARRRGDLLSLLQAETQGKVPSVPARSFDLSFLSAAETDLWVEVRETLSRLVDEVPIRIQHAVTAFGALGAPLAPCRVAVPAGAVRDAPDAMAEIESLRIPDESGGLVFVLTPGPAEPGHEGFTLILKVEELESNLPISQVRVNLCDAQGQLVQSKRTEADGRVTFRGLVGDHALRCKYAGRTWELGVRHISDVTA